ncbi:MAG: 30S ribosomal protein S4 [Candidatus Magasanikbacteria bacterium CG10_big_fil_rev_8_21_14_0_10_36_32]|uniref:Small ribosomal subunit protein uS4 n=1 Tax=Candidatus Magasanikbacteria bacterium CG10_big_fil_rev_8_21_14_0_10_36_32 TaxID=1974646 RepID=A0A2M6W7M3_9BACT|nr:MAG: 30S ribosomal protein S4 [Candidatus Magasanikbacteria bacterium CG10_big_fil_rev_8_21_14_0_10_36_32]
MSLKTNSKCAQCRRAGEKLMLKGEKCLGPKCPMSKRSYPPGMHGPNQKHAKISNYGKQLREKQKVKRMYGILEKQFSNYVIEASKKVGDTGKHLISSLESRLDNVVYRMGLGKSRISARQIVSHGHIMVNGKKLDVPSARVKVGDVVALREGAKNKKEFQGILEKLAKVEAPVWLGLDAKVASAKVLNTPTAENPMFNAKVIIEFYSR